MPADCTAIVLSCRRPQNIPRVLEGILAAPSIGAVILSNNDPAAPLPPLHANPRLRVLQQPRLMPSALRFFLAAETPGEFFLCIDDDLFLRAQQVEQLVAHLREDPARPHGGPWGQRLLVNRAGELQLEMGTYPDQPVDVINRAYAFTKAHAQRFVQVCREFGYTAAEATGPWDDLVLSHCGDYSPMCHDLGAVATCPTSDTPGIALWRDPGFAAVRRGMLARLRERDAG